MSLAVSAPSASGTPVLSGQASGAAATAANQAPTRSRAFLVPRLPAVAPTVALGFSVAITRARPVIVPTYVDGTGATVPVTIAEQWKTRTLQRTTSGLTFTRTFLIHGSRDPATVVNVGPQVGDFDDVLTAFFVTDRKDTIYGGGGGEGDIVQAVVTYTLPGPSFTQTQQATLSYDFGAESEHVDSALVQEHYNSDALRIGNLINVTDDAVQGVEINAPILEFAEEHYFSQTVFSPSFRRTIRDCLQKTNQAPFREWAAGEVLFTGASARKQGVQWYVTFQFRVRRNIAAISYDLYDLKGNVTNFQVDKRGWEYLWVDSIHLPITATGTGLISVVPHGVHVAQVYDEIDFAVLGIGTDPIA